MMSLSFMIKYSTPSILDLRARPFAEQHAVANREVDGDDFPGFIAAAWTDRDYPE
jgi:hypothetical protein